MKHIFMKMKHSNSKRMAIFVLLLFIVVYACQEELRDSVGERNDNRAIEYAKSWYEANKPAELLVASTSTFVREAAMS